MTNCVSTDGADERRIAASAQGAGTWFARRVSAAMGVNLLNLTIHGPVVTTIFRPNEHRLHYLIIVADHNVDQLLELAKFSSDAAKQRIAPPLILTADALKRSNDVFPLEWLDISQFHLTVFGDAILKDLHIEAVNVRLQCERDLRSLDIRLQRGVLASGGKASCIQLLEEAVSDSLVRILRGISWLTGDRKPLLPHELLPRCEQITEQSLLGCDNAIRVDGHRDIGNMRLMIDEVTHLCDWVDRFEKYDR